MDSRLNRMKNKLSSKEYRIEKGAPYKGLKTILTSPMNFIAVEK